MKRSFGSEFDFLDMIRRRQTAQGRDRTVVRGIGDDAAILRPTGSQDTLVTSDILVEGIDFNRDSIVPPLLGHKALAVSLSDIAGMGGSPRWALLSLGIPEAIWRTKFTTQFFDGYFALADRFKVTLVGGDLSRTPDQIVVDSIILGTVSRSRSVLRSGARPGDRIFVTGKLGGAAAGLALIMEGERLTMRNYRKAGKGSLHTLLLRLLRPEPRVKWGEALGQSGLATSMIDLSDGLSSDLAHICKESGAGALIEQSLIPLEPLLAKFCNDRSIDAASLGLNGGEDFELLFTVAPGNVHRLPRMVGKVPATEIGMIVRSPKGVRARVEGKIIEIEPRGYQHFT